MRRATLKWITSSCLRPRPAPAYTAVTSSSVRAEPTTVPRAARAPAPSSHVSPPTKAFVGGETCELGAGARAARGTVVGSARTEDEVTAVYAGAGRGRKQLDVIHFRVALRIHGLPYAPGKLRQGLEVLRIDVEIVPVG